jgi:hypothetical protein
MPEPERAPADDRASISLNPEEPAPIRSDDEIEVAPCLDCGSRAIAVRRIGADRRGGADSAVHAYRERGRCDPLVRPRSEGKVLLPPGNSGSPDGGLNDLRRFADE